MAAASGTLNVEAIAKCWSSPSPRRLPLCESRTLTPSRPPMCFWIDRRLAASAGVAQAAASPRPINILRVSIRVPLVFREHDDHVVLCEGVFLGFLRIHVDAVAVILVVGVFHDAIADRGLTALRGRLEHRVEIHRAAEPDVVGHGTNVYLTALGAE